MLNEAISPNMLSSNGVIITTTAIIHGGFQQKIQDSKVFSLGDIFLAPEVLFWATFGAGGGPKT